LGWEAERPIRKSPVEKQRRQLIMSRDGGKILSRLCPVAIFLITIGAIFLGLALPSSGQGQLGEAKLAAAKSRSSGAKSLVEQGQETFNNNCSPCHRPDSETTKVGPGLKGLFKRKLTPARKVPVTEENILSQIRNGGGGMPPFAQFTAEQLEAVAKMLRCCNRFRRPQWSKTGSFFVRNPADFLSVRCVTS
jgi:mono/diheme cytochrome c family protein